MPAGGGGGGGGAVQSRRANVELLRSASLLSETLRSIVNNLPHELKTRDRVHAVADLRCTSRY